MLLIPAIDIKNNNCVRLEKGDINKFYTFSKNPALVINKWINYNIKRFHLIDLDGAIAGKPKNLLSIKSIINYTKNSVELQMGGGVRDVDTVDYYFNLGINYVILGTRAVLDLKFLESVSFKNEDKIILAIDLKNLKIAINGWKNYYKLNLYNFFKKISDFPIESIIYTDIKRDGTLKGLNINMFLKISKNTNKPAIISGGLSDYKDIEKIFSLQKKNLLGIICGKSIYLGKINIFKNIKKINYFNKYYIS
ncbi:HisA/HisF-related TIM barrel protein [Candidatus Nasuia deltocephalinicola]|uniref:1-(5-phosphoribosyl)-5-[(5- phosphoribosylamino)methylideneamino]imidazole-4- carboxamide isomerase n=1 Tax=Candidatus Nasuia deltocephalincola TaxID=1160784 RepID=UPI00216B4613|nr:HisA/HisF-related TIM barrel protein [Candidatus Nasuia deltocephalinicola]